MKRILLVTVTLLIMGTISIGLILIDTQKNQEYGLDEILIDDEAVAFGAEIAHDATLNLIVQGNGTIEACPFQTAYASGTRVTFVPHPQVGWVFIGWSGDVPSKKLESQSITIPLFEGEYNIIAIFKQK